jgi:membrane-bound lytic murein transglycosylase MltF
MDQLKVAALTTSGQFAPCGPYIEKFKQYGAQYGSESGHEQVESRTDWPVPPILLASFAMQESTCNQWATGGSGEAGLMQIALVNCGDAPGGK